MRVIGICVGAFVLLIILSLAVHLSLRGRMAETRLGRADYKRGASDDQTAAPGSPRMAMAREAEQSDTAPTSPEPRTPVLPTNRKLIRTLTLQLVSKDTQDTARKVEDLMAGCGGYVSNMTAERRDDSYYYTMMLRVPSAQFERARRELRKLGLRVEHEAIATQEVTAQYVDLVSRKKTLLLAEKELADFLAESKKQRHDVSDIMKVYQQMTGVRQQIEQIQGRLNVYDSLVALSTVNLTITPDASVKPVVDKGWRPLQRVRDSFRTLLVTGQAVIDVAIYFAIVILPCVIVIGAVIYLTFRRARRRTVRASA